MPVTAAVIAAVADRIIASARYVQEHNAVASNAVENFRLTKGNDRVIVPKVGQFTMQTLVDGQDIVEEQALGLSTVTLTAAEVGGKVVITDKSTRENGSTDIFRMIGRQFGDASARRMDTDVIALFTNLNGGTTFGAAAATFTIGNFDWTAKPLDVYVGDVDFLLQLSSGLPAIWYDAANAEYQLYDRTSNTLIWRVSVTNKMTFGFTSGQLGLPIAGWM